MILQSIGDLVMKHALTDKPAAAYDQGLSLVIVVARILEECAQFMLVDGPKIAVVARIMRKLIYDEGSLEIDAVKLRVRDISSCEHAIKREQETSSIPR